VEGGGQGATATRVQVLLLERLLQRKDLRLAAMAARLEAQTRRLAELEADQAWLLALPGMAAFRWVAGLLLPVVRRLGPARRWLLGPFLHQEPDMCVLLALGKWIPPFRGRLVSMTRR
jgi:hypothetical protein